MITRFITAILLLVASFITWAEPPVPGDRAPGFSLPDQSGTLRSLTDYRGQWLLLYFYPKDDTPGCTTEACEFRDQIVVFNALGVKIVGISVDDSASHAVFKAKHQLPFDLLADADGEVAARYDALRDLWVTKIAKRYSFLINPEGVIARRYLEVDPQQHATQVAADLKRLIEQANATGSGQR